MATRILIVEDSPTQAESLGALLEGAGYAVAHAASGEEGLARFEAGPPDIVVSDIVMPGGVDGYELCRRIKIGEHGGTPVVLLTSLSDPMDIIHGLECGADNFITKPYDPGHLLDRLQLLLATRRARERDRVRAGVKVIFMGREFTISSEREQILDLLVTTFEEAVRQNRDLRQREEELTAAQTQLARYARSLEAQLESILSSVPDVLFSVTADGAEVRYVSPAVSHVFGCTPDAFTLEYWREHVHADDRDQAWTAFRQAGAAGAAQALEYRYLIRPDEMRWISGHFVPAANGTGRIDGIARDITDHMRAREALRASEVRLAAILDAALDAVITIDGSGVITGWNRRAEALFGWPAAEAVGRVLATTIIPPQHREAHTQGLARFLATGEGPVLNRRIEISALHREGREFPVELAISPVRLGDSWLFSAFVRDLSERRRLEAQLQQAQKMEAVGRLAGGIAHDFNNVLTAITGYTELLRDKFPTGDPRREDLEQIEQASQRASALTRQLLAFSRKQVLLPKVLSLNEVVAGVDRMLRRIIGEPIDLVTRLHPDLGRVKVDPGQIEQVLMNLAVNARDAMPEGGKLTIETANVELDAAYQRTHGPVEAGRYVLLAVSDTGTGMDAETKARIFEPFFTTKEKGKGTGLGLATCYGIIKQSGGHIWVYSELAHGTTVKVYLPRVEDPADVSAPSAPPPLPAGGSETILLVEDDEAVRKLAQEVLTRHGYTVLVARQPVEALALCGQHSGPIHLLLTDVVMPGMSGRQLADHLTLAGLNIKVLYASGYTDDAIVHHGVLEAGVAFLQKPFTPAALARRVREVLDAGQAPAG